MNYELAKELRDAGFPMPVEIEIHSQFGSRLTGNLPATKHNITRYPTLEELIEACAEPRFLKLWRNQKTGEGAVQLEGESLDAITWYPSLLEAVARLWLALNKK